jgi:nucleoside-diphosphate-sugar epimerase
LVRRDYCILRFAGLYGPGRLISAAALQRGEPIPSDGDAWLNLVHRDDAASALLAAVERGKDREIYNIADGHPALRRDFYLKLADLLNAPPPTFAPELARRHRGNRRIYAGKARTELGWSPRYPSYIEGLEAIARETG